MSNSPPLPVEAGPNLLLAPCREPANCRIFWEFQFLQVRHEAVSRLDGTGTPCWHMAPHPHHSCHVMTGRVLEDRGPQSVGILEVGASSFLKVYGRSNGRSTSENYVR